MPSGNTVPVPEQASPCEAARGTSITVQIRMGLIKPDTGKIYRYEEGIRSLLIIPHFKIQALAMTPLALMGSASLFSKLYSPGELTTIR